MTDEKIKKSRLVQAIKDYRFKMGVTQESLARKLQVSVRTIQGWEGGKPISDMGKAILSTIINID